MNNFSDSNLQFLLKLAAAKLGVKENELKSAVEHGDLGNVKNLDLNKVNEILSNKEMKEKFLSSPQAQEIMKKFSQR